jgi:hypothetical protein
MTNQINHVKQNETGGTASKVAEARTSLNKSTARFGGPFLLVPGMGIDLEVEVLS